MAPEYNRFHNATFRFTRYIPGLIVLACLVSTPLILYAQSQGPNSPGNATYGAAGCLACPGGEWSNPLNVMVSDSQFSSATLSEFPFCFMSTCYFTRAFIAKEFGFNIPQNSMIKGIRAYIQKNASEGNVVNDTLVSLFSGITMVGQNRALPGFWTTSNIYDMYGDTNDLWGYAWTPLEINSPDFGIYLTPVNKGANIVMANIDHIQMTVYYTSPVICDSVIADYSYVTQDTSYYTVVHFTNHSANDTAWLWDFGDSTYSSEHSPYHAYTTPGLNVTCTPDDPVTSCFADYVVCLTSSNDCSLAMVCDTLRHVRFCCNVTGTEENNFDKVKLVYDPVYFKIQFRLPANVYPEPMFTLFNIHGQIISKQPVTGNVISLKGLPKGLYLGNLTFKQDFLKTVKIMVR